MSLRFAGSMEKAGVCDLSSEWTVAELLKRCLLRPADETAWEEFVHRYHSTIRATVSRTFARKAREDREPRGNWSEDVVDDLVQSVYARLVDEKSHALEMFHGEFDQSIYKYLSIISVNVVLDYFRLSRAQKRPRISVSLEDVLFKGRDGIAGESTLSQSKAGEPVGEGADLLLSEIERALLRTTKGPNQNRDILIFKLRFYEGLTLQEITSALNLGITPISVGSVLTRITAKLRVALKESRMAP